MSEHTDKMCCITKPLRGFIKHQANRGYIDAVQTQWLFNIADEIDAKHEQAIAATLGSEIDGNTSDGYHTFDELYHHRAVLFSVVVAAFRDRAWKSKLHHDDTMYDGMFIVGIDTPWGQASYHYDIDPYWDMFGCEVRERAPEWDGHTPEQAIERIGRLAATLGSRYDRDAAESRVERFCTEYAALLARAKDVEPLTDEFGRLEQEEARMIRALLDSLASGKPMGPCIERSVVTGEWTPTRGWVCGNCNHGLHGYPRFCGNCGGRINYEKREDAPKAVLD